MRRVVHEDELDRLREQLAACRAINRQLWADASNHMARIAMLEEKLRGYGLRIPDYKRTA